MFVNLVLSVFPSRSVAFFSLRYSRNTCLATFTDFFLFSASSPSTNFSTLRLINQAHQAAIVFTQLSNCATAQCTWQKTPLALRSHPRHDKISRIIIHLFVRCQYMVSAKICHPYISDTVFGDIRRSSSSVWKLTFFCLTKLFLVVKWMSLTVCWIIKHLSCSVLRNIVWF